MLTKLISSLRCAIGRHQFNFVGLDFKDEVHVCRDCGKRHVKRHTLRINRLRRPSGAVDTEH